MPVDAALQQAIQKFLDEPQFRQDVIKSGQDGGGSAVAQLLRDGGAELSEEDVRIIDSIDWNRPETDLRHEATQALTAEGW